MWINFFVSTPSSFPKARIAANRVKSLAVWLKARAEIEFFSSEIFHFAMSSSDCTRIDSTG